MMTRVLLIEAPGGFLFDSISLTATRTMPEKTKYNLVDDSDDSFQCGITFQVKVRLIR